MKTGIVVGAAPLGTEKNILRKLLLNNREDYYVVAADGGICFFIEENIEPDHFIGDMDSANESFLRTVKDIFPELLVNACSPIKDETDMEIGLKDAFEHECNEAYMFGGLGGDRISHTFANVQLMHHFLNAGKKVTAFSDNKKLYLLDKDTEYSEDMRGFISLFSISDSSQISIKGFKYEYEGKLTNSYALGVSNEFTGNKASISLSKGTILVVEEGLNA